MTITENPIPQVDLWIKQGASWSMSFDITDNNDNIVTLTDYTATCKIKDRPGGVLLATPTCTVSESIGRVTLELTAAQTKAIDWSVGVYDILLQHNTDDPSCPFEGKVYIDPLVTV